MLGAGRLLANVLLFISSLSSVDALRQFIIGKLLRDMKITEILPEQNCPFPCITQKCIHFFNFKIATKQRNLGRVGGEKGGDGIKFRQRYHQNLSIFGVFCVFRIFLLINPPPWQNHILKILYASLLSQLTKARMPNSCCQESYLIFYVSFNNADHKKGCSTNSFVNI